MPGKWKARGGEYQYLITSSSPNIVCMSSKSFAWAGLKISLVVSMVAFSPWMVTSAISSGLASALDHLVPAAGGSFYRLEISSGLAVYS